MREQKDIIINGETLETILERHNKLVYEDSDGRIASLVGANLEWANLEWANLGGANLEGANLEGANLGGANLGGANLGGANLEGANLVGANLVGANLAGANLYFSCLPLWCGGLNLKLDRLQMAQLAYHFCSMICDDNDVKRLQKYLYGFANEFADSREDLKNRKYKEDNTL